MGRYLAQPLDAGVLHRNTGIEALGDCPADEGGALLLEQLDQPFRLCGQRVDLRSLPVEERGDGTLLCQGWEDSGFIQVACFVEILDTYTLLN